MVSSFPASGVTVRVTNDVRPFHELGQRFATELGPVRKYAWTAGFDDGAYARALRAAGAAAIAASTSAGEASGILPICAPVAGWWRSKVSPPCAAREAPLIRSCGVKCGGVVAISAG